MKNNILQYTVTFWHVTAMYSSNKADMTNPPYNSHLNLWNGSIKYRNVNFPRFMVFFVQQNVFHLSSEFNIFVFIFVLFYNDFII